MIVLIIYFKYSLKLVNIKSMYICKKKDVVTIAQMELIDFFSDSRKIYFNMENERESKRAERILKPKGLIKRRRINKSKKKAYKQTNMMDLYSVSNTAKKSKKIKLIKKSPQKSIIHKKLKHHTNLNTEITKESKVDLEANIKQTLEPIIESKKKNINNDYKKQINTKKPEKVNRISEDLVKKIGKGGNLEIICPICEDSIFFSYDDVDSKKLHNTRICSCDAILRISTVYFNKNIFNNIGISNIAKDQIETYENNIRDEYNNKIFTYAIKDLIST